MFETFLPVIWYGIADLEFKRSEFLTNPYLYLIGPKNIHFTTPLFLANVFNAMYNALFITLICYFAMDGKVITEEGHNSFFWVDSTLVCGVVVLVVNLRVLQCTSNHTMTGTVIIALSTLAFWI